MSKTDIRHEIVYHMARAYFADGWGSYCEEIGPMYPPGSEILDIMPDDEDTDPSAVLAAFSLADQLEKQHGMHLADIFDEAVRISEEAEANGEDGGDRVRTEEMFGHYAAMSAMGHGVGLWDALGSKANKFVNVPRGEFSWIDFDPEKYPDPRDLEESA